MHLSNVKIQSI